MTAHDSILLAAGSVFVAASVVVPVVLKQRGLVSAGLCRGLIHSLAGLGILILPFFENRWPAVVTASIVTAAVAISGPHSMLRPLRGFFESIAEDDERHSGALYGPVTYCASLLILALLSAVGGPRADWIVTSAALFLIISDPLASFVGRRWGFGSFAVPWTGSRRSIAGSAAFFLSALAVTAVSVIVFPPAGRIITVRFVAAMSAVSAAVATCVEAVVPGRWDDAAVPLASAAAMCALSCFI